MRNISFALTTDQVLAGTKTVTRRLGWKNLKLAEELRPVKKSQGLKKGEKVSVLREPIRVVDVRREPLNRMLTDLDYGFEECAKEGFANHPAYRFPWAFVAMFCATHKCETDAVITRIEFEYL